LTSINKGSKVSFHYKLLLADFNKLVDSTDGEDPFTITIGEGGMLEALEARMIGLEAGHKEVFEISFLETYNANDEEVLTNMPREDFPKEMKLETGLVVGFETPGGDSIPGVVVEVKEKEVVLDFAHPLAGHDLIFDVEIISVDNSNVIKPEFDDDIFS
jgi:FKBP-type peptidyl-prolyl cis-trans isomerase 2